MVRLGLASVYLHQKPKSTLPVESKRSTTNYNLLLQAHVELGDQTLLFDESSSRLRWFLLPSESYSYLHNTGSNKPKIKVPFTPVQYPREKPIVSRTIIVPEHVAQKETFSVVSEKNLSRRTDSETRDSFQQEVISSLSDGFNSESNSITLTDNSSESNALEVCESEAFAGSSDHKRSRDDITCDSGTETKVAKLTDIDFPPVPVTSVASQARESKEPGVSVSEKRTIVYEGNACFTKRTSDAADQHEVRLAKYRWHNPPKHIFKPTVQVQTTTFIRH